MVKDPTGIIVKITMIVVNAITSVITTKGTTTIGDPTTATIMITMETIITAEAIATHLVKDITSVATALVQPIVTHVTTTTIADATHMVIISTAMAR